MYHFYLDRDHFPDGIITNNDRVKIECSIHGTSYVRYKLLKTTKLSPCIFCNGRVPNGYWTKERCIEDAKKYKTRVQWSKNSPVSQIAYKNNWIEECCKHMLPPRNKTYWTKERCIEDAKKYKTRVEWQKKSRSAYQRAHKNGWLEVCCKHMIVKHKPSNYWTKARCLKEAKKYKSVAAWKSKSGSSYNKARKKGWLEKMSTHMSRKRVTNWTKARCLKEAKKYKSRSEWEKKDTSSYQAARKNNWLDECTRHMRFLKRLNGFWTKEHCIQDAKKYKTKTDWKKNSGGAYSRAVKNGWLVDCCVHMPELIKPYGYWDIKENVLEDAKKYNSLVEWVKNSSSRAITSARANGWFEECTRHMVVKYKPKGYWTKERCIEDALKYKTSTEWKAKSSSAYTAATRNKWFKNIHRK